MDYGRLMGGDLKSTSTGESHDVKSLRLGETAPSAGPSERAKPHVFPEILHPTVRVEALKTKAKTAKRSVWLSVSRYRLSDSSVQDQESGYHAYSLTVRLRFSGKLILDETPDFSKTPTPSRHEESPRMPGSTSSQTLPLFDRPWVDESQDFNMRAILSTVRNPSCLVKNLGANFTWYTDAVPVDALFPPGIPLSAKEILAYYPHHIRWRDVMLRLTRNDYRGGDIVGIQVGKFSYSYSR